MTDWIVVDLRSNKQAAGGLVFSTTDMALMMIELFCPSGLTNIKT